MRRKKKKYSKIQSQRIHAKRRALERCDVVLNRHNMREMVEKIERGHASFIKRQSQRVLIYRMKVGVDYYPVVYDKNRKTIVTILPKDAF